MFCVKKISLRQKRVQKAYILGTHIRDLRLEAKPQPHLRPQPQMTAARAAVGAAYLGLRNFVMTQSIIKKLTT